VISEQWEGEFDFHYLSDHELYSEETSISNLASAASKAQKAKFRFPSSDPKENQVIDNRTPEQKMADILRTWSQLLTVEETQVWNEISRRDLTRDILTSDSGLRTTKSIIDREIRQFRQLAAGKKSEMLKTLQRLPEELLLPVDNQSQPSDPSDILEATPNPLSFNESPAVSYLDSEFISNYCEPLTDIQVEKPIIQILKSNLDYSNLKNICTTQVLNVRDQFNNRVKLQKIFRKNSRLLFQYMLLLKTQCTLTRRISSAFDKLLKFKKILFILISEQV
jgi:hypothetical protein